MVHLHLLNREFFALFSRVFLKFPATLVSEPSHFLPDSPLCLHFRVSHEIHHGLSDTLFFKFLCILGISSQLKCMPAWCIVDFACLIDSKNEDLVHWITHFFSELETTDRFGGRKSTAISFCSLVMTLGTKI